VERAKINRDKMTGSDWTEALDAAEVPDILRATVDQALVLDENGIVLDQLRGTDPVFGSEEWLGRPWREAVTRTTRPKLERMLEEANETGVSRFRQLNHPIPDGEDVPVGYTIVRFGSPGRLLAIGRNLSALATLQRQLVEAQQTMETEYWHVRQAEARYRILFQQSREPVFLLEADSLEVTDANNAAAALLNAEPSRLVGRPFPPAPLSVGPTWDDEARDALQASLRRVADGVVDREVVDARVGEGGTHWRMSVSIVRFDGSRTLLVRLHSDEVAPAAGTPGIDVMALLQNSPDGFVVTDDQGDILYANDTFLGMAQVANEQTAVGQSLANWLGRPGADLTVLLTNLRNRGQIRLFPTEVQGEQGLHTPVEVSGVAALDAEEPCMGITLRDIGRRLPSNSGESATRELSGAVQRLSTKVGEVSLKQLVEDTVGLVELHFIDAALELTGDNRTAAAELLGLSRQSLYTKLKRYNLDSNDG